MHDFFRETMDTKQQFIDTEGFDCVKEAMEQAVNKPKSLNYRKGSEYVIMIGLKEHWL